jgi:hypothetical protein
LTNGRAAAASMTGEAHAEHNGLLLATLLRVQADPASCRWCA